MTGCTFPEKLKAILTTDLYTQNFWEYFCDLGSSGHYSFRMERWIGIENKGNGYCNYKQCCAIWRRFSFSYITGRGPSDLARAYLFRPGVSACRVILPDNALELDIPPFLPETDISLFSNTPYKDYDGFKKKTICNCIATKTKVYYSLNAEVSGVNGKTGSVRCLRQISVWSWAFNNSFI